MQTDDGYAASATPAAATKASEVRIACSRASWSSAAVPASRIAYAAWAALCAAGGEAGQQELDPQQRPRDRGPGEVALGAGRAPVPAGQPDLLPHGHRPPVVRQRGR
ncbi:hypothetical protein OG323_37390 (plasmid) [Streptomyces cyaneofuscatus]|uniref:hypothetical protein n=1 Tax=Streptomyces cyaneofuscatus TaxID=66883 RepID=UPI0038697B07|nr:hypothetical protein OG323_37390 [Streptomyces cyaneofuscatus]